MKLYLVEPRRVSDIENSWFKPKYDGMEHILLFIDHANVFHNLEKRHIRIDFGKFKDIIAKNRRLINALIYMGLMKDLKEKKQHFLEYLEEAGFKIQERPVKIAQDGTKKQAGMDVLIYKDITESAEEDFYDKAVLVSGDEDFVYAVERIKELGKEIEIWSFKDSLSYKLMQEAGEENIHYIDDILDKITIKVKSTPTSPREKLGSRAQDKKSGV